MVNIPEHVDKICVHTGNILNLNEVKKNAGQNSSEEVRLNEICLLVVGLINFSFSLTYLATSL